MNEQETESAMSDTEDIETLRAECRSADPQRKVRALIELIKAHDVGSMPEIVPLLEDPDDDVRAEAARALGLLGRGEPERLGPRLLPLLNDPEELVRDEAVQAFGLIHHPPAVPRLLMMLRDDPSWIVRASAAEALGGQLSTEVVDRLVETVRDPDELSPVRMYAAASLGRGTPEVDLPIVAALIRQLQDEPMVGPALLVAGYQLGGQHYLATILRLLAHGDEEDTARLLNDIDYLTYPPQPPTLATDADRIRSVLRAVPQRHPLSVRHVQAIIDRLPGSDDRPVTG